MPRLIPLILLAIALILTAGCTEQAPASVISSGNVSASVSKVEDHWNLGLGCYWRAYGTVYNTGDVTARDVTAYIQLIDTSSGNIRDSKTISVGDLARGDSRSFEVSLDGECGHAYRVEVRPTEGE